MAGVEKALRFLAENCGLAIRWLEDVVQFLKDKDKDNTVVVANDHRYLSNVIKRTKIPKSIAPVFMEAEFGPILREHNLPLPIVTSQFSIVVQKLQAVIERLSANNWLEVKLQAVTEPSGYRWSASH